MADRKVELPDLEISSFAAPTAEDLAQMSRLSEPQRRAVIAREIQKGIDSGISEMTMEDIWAEAMRNVASKAKAPGAL